MGGDGTPVSNSFALTMTLSPTASITATYVPSSTPFPTATYSPALSTAVANGECLNSFESFAYNGPRNERLEITAPLSPWQIEAVQPPHPYEGYYPYIFQRVALSRPINDHQEIWTIGDIYGEQLQGIKSVITIYSVESQTWEFVSSDISDTGLVVGQLFVDSAGGVWGRVTWQRTYEYTTETFPVLSRFNETTRQFEIAEGVLEVLLVREIPMDNGGIMIAYDGTRILLDDQDNFWIFPYDRGLYHYNPSTQTTDQRTDFPDVYVGGPKMAPDGSIYFATGTDELEYSPFFLRSAVFQFIPDTGELISIDLPNEDLPSFSGLLIDSTGRLWLGSIAYREPDGTWHIMYPHPEAYLALVNGGGYSYVWGMPYPMLESSDGIIWFQKFLDTSGWVDGTAWYDPTTGEGCMFTNMAANIIEDSEQRLWLIANETLYNYTLNP